jgi:hypothetical protein
LTSKRGIKDKQDNNKTRKCHPRKAKGRGRGVTADIELQGKSGLIT